MHSKALWLQSFSLVSIYGKPYSEETQAALWRTPWSKKPRLPANSQAVSTPSWKPILQPQSDESSPR